MDLFQHRYYNINKILMSIIGVWPYQAVCFNRTIFTVTLFLKASGILPQILAVVKYHDDWRVLMDCVAPLLLVLGSTTKLLCCTCNSQKILRLLKCIRDNWKLWSGDEEVNILHRYAEQGRKVTIVYAVTLCLFAVIYGTQPVTPKIIDVLLKNGSEIGKFPFPVDYYKLDAQKYYFYIIMHLSLCGSMELVCTIAADTIFIVFVQHGCSLFSALGHKLQRTEKSKISAAIGENVYLDKKVMSYDYLASCIDRHNDAIEFADLIEATYSWYFFFIGMYTIIGISITGLQVIHYSKYHEGMTRYIFALLVVLLHVYLNTYLCQMFMDHSISVRYYILNSKWYNLSSKDQKLLYLVTMRCNVPCKLTAGKTFVMSVESFVVILKTSLSYFTFLRSM